MYLSLMRSSLPLRLELRQETRLTEDFRVYERNEKPLYHRGTPTSPLEPAGKGGKTKKKSPSFLSIKGGLRNYIYGRDGRRQEAARRRASRNLRGRTGLTSASDPPLADVRAAALPSIFQGRYTAGGVEETDERLARLPAGVLPQTGHQEGITAALRGLGASSGRPAAC